MDDAPGATVQGHDVVASIEVNGKPVRVLVPAGCRLAYYRDLIPRPMRTDLDQPWGPWHYGFIVEPEGKTRLQWVREWVRENPHAKDVVVLAGDIGLIRLDPAPNGPMERRVRVA